MEKRNMDRMSATRSAAKQDPELYQQYLKSTQTTTKAKRQLDEKFEEDAA
jgi:hypothetical protein